MQTIRKDRLNIKDEVRNKLLEGDASVLDWIKIGGLTLLSLFLFAMAGKKN